jgi:hypothetical protein
MNEIISASRRTDIPACYPDRLESWIRAGYVDVTNPYSGAVTRISLDPAAVHTLVLWSKNFTPLLARDRFLRTFRLYFLFTLNDMPGLEPGTPLLADRFCQLNELAARYGSERIAWRFDPIVFRHDGPVTGLDSFARIADQVAGAGVKRLIISFLDFYGKVSRRNGSLNLGMVDPPADAKRDWAARLAELAGSLGIAVESCCEDLSGVPGIAPGGCIDGRLLGKLNGIPASTIKDPGQRKNCRCTVSRDIGSYQTMPCPSGCRYCYANPLMKSMTGDAA